MAKNHILDAAANVAQSVNLALSEGLTGVPFFQQHQERVDKRTATAEGLAANRARLQAALGTELVSKKFLDAFPDGFEGMVKSPDFDKNLAMAMDVQATDIQDTKTAEADMQQATLAYHASGAGAGGPAPTTAQGLRLAAADHTRKEIEKNSQKDIGSSSVTGALRTFNTYDELDTPKAGDVIGLAGVHDAVLKRIDGLGIPDEDKKSLKREVTVAYELTSRNLEERVKTADLVTQVESGDLGSLATLSGAEFEKVAKSSGIGVVVDKVDTSLQTLAPLAQDDALMAELAQSDDPKVKDGVATMALLRERGAYTMRELLDDPELIKQVQGLDMNAILSETGRANFNLSERDPEIIRFQQELDAPTPDVQRILYGDIKPDAAALLHTGSKGPNEFEIQGRDDIYKKFRNDFTHNLIPKEDLRTIQQALRYGGLAQSSPTLAAMQPQIEAKMVQDVVDGFEPPQEFVDKDELVRLSGTEEQVYTMLEGVLFEKTLAASRLSTSNIDLATALKNAPPGSVQNTSKLIASFRQEQRAPSGVLQRPLFVPSYANLTRSTDDGQLQKTIDKLSQDMNTDDPVRRARISNELTLRTSEMRNVRKRQVFGPIVSNIVGALASPDGGYMALELAITPYLSTSGSGAIGSTATLSPSSTLITEKFAEFEGATASRRETLLTEIIDLAAPLIVASSPGAKLDGLTVSDFAHMWSEQMAIHDSGQMQIAAGQLSQGPFDTIPEDGWDQDRKELNSWKIMHEMGRE